MHFQVKGIISTGLYMDNNAKQKDMIECLSLKPGKGSKKKKKSKQIIKEAELSPNIHQRFVNP